MKDHNEESKQKLSDKLKEFGIKPKKETIEIDDSKPGNVKRTFYLSHFSNNKLDRIHAKTLVKGKKRSLSAIIEDAIDLLYQIEMSERVKNFRG